MAANQTKLTIMVKREEELMTRIHDLQVELDRMRAEREWASKTPVNVPCGHCGQMLATEFDFAGHFVIPDERYMNLGHCPRETDKSDETAEITRYMVEAKRNATR